MTREEGLDWLYRLRSEIYVFMPKEWQIPMLNAINMAISALSENKCFDGMTNGEVIQALFPNPRIETMSHTVWVGYEAMTFTRKWWNAPYKAESEGK